MKNKTVLVASLQKTTFVTIRDSLTPRFAVVHTCDFERALEELKKRVIHSLFIDIDFFPGDEINADGKNRYREMVNKIFLVHPAVNVIIVCQQQKIREAVQAMKAGAGNYITCPVDPEEVKFVVDSIHEEERIQSELDYLRDQFWETDALDIVRTNSPAMKNVFDKIRSVAPTKTTVLLSGDTGTGKGVLAGLIHGHSNRRQKQFIGVHCGAIPDTLLESELFGHEKGSFTGAHKRKLGNFEIASGGTIFLDEIGTVSAGAQIKLLKVLQDRTFQRVGGEEMIEADARIITATNANLKKMTAEGDFRKDLYYRLNVFPIEIPPLFERREDIPILVEILLSRLNQYYSKDLFTVHPLVLEAFDEYVWPGNIRELENVLERAYILEKSSILMPESFPPDIFPSGYQITQVPLRPSDTLAEVRRRGIENMERQYLKELLSIHNGKINATARRAAISTRQLHKLMKKYDIHKEDFK